MGRDEAAPSLWRTRITWAVMGASVAAILLWKRDPPEEASVDEVVMPTPQDVAALPPSHEMEASDDADSSPATTTEDSTSTSTSTSTSGYASTGAEVLPEIPLPQMPGSRFMRRFRRPNDDGEGWLITLGLSIPAPGSQVEGFYRKALEDEDMKVFGGSVGAGPIGEGHRSTLKARGKHASVEITIHQRAGKLRSIVRIYWKARPL